MSSKARKARVSRRRMSRVIACAMAPDLDLGRKVLRWFGLLCLSPQRRRQDEILFKTVTLARAYSMPVPALRRVLEHQYRQTTINTGRTQRSKPNTMTLPDRITPEGKALNLDINYAEIEPRITGYGEPVYRRYTRQIVEYTNYFQQVANATRIPPAPLEGIPDELVLEKVE